MTDILATLLERPDVVSLTKALQEELEAEKQKRHQFYEVITPSDKAEFIGGEIIFHSPVIKAHNQISLRIATLFQSYVLSRNLGLVGMEKLLIALSRNDYEPDVCYFSPEKSKDFTSKQMRFPAPDLVVEVLSDSTAARDRGIKYEDYAFHGVSEYWIVDPETATLEQYLLEGTAYRLQIKAQDGHVHCQAIEGLSFPIKACFDDQENVMALKGLLQ